MTSTSPNATARSLIASASAPRASRGRLCLGGRLARRKLVLGRRRWGNDRSPLLRLRPLLARRLRRPRGLCRRRRGGRRARLLGFAGVVVEIPEELRIRAQQKARVVALERRRVSLHRPVEGEEVWILTEGVGEDAVLLGIAGAPDPLGLSRRVGLDHGDLAVCRAADAPRGALAFGTELGRLPLPLGLHPAVDRLHVRFGQVDALDTHIDDVDAKRRGLLVDLTENGAHQLLALVAYHRRKARGAEYSPERGFKDRPESRLGTLLIAQALEEQQGIDDLVTRE